MPRQGPRCFPTCAPDSLGWPHTEIRPYHEIGSFEPRDPAPSGAQDQAPPEVNPSLSNSSWRDQAACRGLDPEVFYPVSEEEEATAKSICADCTVRQSCLEHAITHRETEGICGGATERERRRSIRQRRRTA